MTRFPFSVSAISRILILCGLLAVPYFTGCKSDEEKIVESWPIPITEEGMQRKLERHTDETKINKELEFLHSLPDEPYRVCANDIFDVQVYGHENLTAISIVVTPDGYVSIPLVGPCKIGGMTLPEATEYLTEQVSKFVRSPQVALIPRLIKGFTFTIGGRVVRPGRYPLIAGTKLQDAIADASGLSLGEYRGDTVELADLHNSYVIREGRKLPVDFDKALLQGDPLNNIPIRNGDYIYLPSAMSSSIYVLGEVGTCRYVTFKEDMTLLKVFSFTGGLKESYNEWATVLRGMDTDKPMAYRVNIDRILHGKAEDFSLKANDIVYVPKSGIEAYNYYVKQSFPTIQLFNMLTGPFSNAAMYMGIL